jgi:hypothetical protein
MGHVSRKHCEEIMMNFCILMPLDQFWKLVFVDRHILASAPQETCFILVNLAVEDFYKQPAPGMRGHPICFGPNEEVQQRVAIVDQLHSEVCIFFIAAYESYEFHTSLFISIKSKASIKFIKISEMKNSPTLRKITGELIMFGIILKLQENSFTIGLKLRTLKFLISLINFNIGNSCGIVNLIFMDEQGDKKCNFRFISSKQLVRDDLFEVAMSVVGVVKNRSERKVTELNDDDSSPEISFDKFDTLKVQNKFWHPVPKLMFLNGFKTRNVSFRQFFCILESFFLNNLEVVATVAKDLSLKNSYEFRKLRIDLQVLAEWLQRSSPFYSF